jgi:ribosome recycling factor
MLDDITKDAKDAMESVIDALKKQLTSIRTGRANPSMLDGVRVSYYDMPTPLNQVATVSAQDARLLIIKPYEKKIIKDIERAIVEANLGFNPSSDGDFVRVPMPPLSTERRKEYVKLAKGKCEDAKVAVRAARRDSNEMLKEAHKEGSVTEDQEKRGLTKIQEATDVYVKRIDDMLAKKEAEIMEV